MKATLAWKTLSRLPRCALLYILSRDLFRFNAMDKCSASSFSSEHTFAIVIVKHLRTPPQDLGISAKHSSTRNNWPVTRLLCYLADTIDDVIRGPRQLRKANSIHIHCSLQWAIGHSYCLTYNVLDRPSVARPGAADRCTTNVCAGHDHT